MDRAVYRKAGRAGKGEKAGKFEHYSSVVLVSGLLSVDISMIVFSVMRSMHLFLSGIAFLLIAGCSSTPSVPLEKMSSRQMPLHFGLYVTPDPAQNPIDPPERFTGFHTALDIEILPDEEAIEVPVYAICDGEVIYARWTEGYGGVLVQSCVIDDHEVTVLYGHLDTASLTHAVGDPAVRGDRIAVLAPAHSKDSDQTRKHLHLGIHKGPEIELMGYVDDESRLQEFIDPMMVLH